MWGGKEKENLKKTNRKLFALQLLLPIGFNWAINPTTKK